MFVVKMFIEQNSNYRFCCMQIQLTIELKWLEKMDTSWSRRMLSIDKFQKNVIIDTNSFFYELRLIYLIWYFLYKSNFGNSMKVTESAVVTQSAKIHNFSSS